MKARAGRTIILHAIGLENEKILDKKRVECKCDTCQEPSKIMIGFYIHENGPRENVYRCCREKCDGKKNFERVEKNNGFKGQWRATPAKNSSAWADHIRKRFTKAV